MYISLRAALLAGAFAASSALALADPISLSDALSQGTETSPRLVQAKALAEATEARARQAGVSPNPEIGLDVEDIAGTGAFSGLRSMETTIAISQRLELGGKRSARVAVARAERDIAFLAYQRAHVDLAFDIRVAFAQLQASDDRVNLARENVGRAEELAKTANILVEVGRDPPLRRLRADALLAEAKAEEAQRFGDLLAARRLLATLIGSVDSELSALPSNAEEQAPAMAAGISNLDEKLVEAERDAADARIKLARSNSVPDITASGGIRRFSEGRETAFIVGVSIPLPFRDRNRGNIEAAQSESIAANAALSIARLDASRARYDASIMLGAADVRLEALSGAGIAQAEEAVRIASIGYSAGKFSLVELIDSQTALNSAKLSVIEARFDRARALAALIRANAQ